MKNNQPNTLKCLVCENDVTELHYNKKDTSPLYSRMWGDGAVDVFTCGYGSKLDGDGFVFAICDSCIKTKLSNDIIKIHETL